MKKYVPIHKQGDVCPNGVPALVKGATMRTFGFRIISDPSSIAPSCASPNLQLCAQKYDYLPPPPRKPYISETAFSHRFQK